MLTKLFLCFSLLITVSLLPAQENNPNNITDTISVEFELFTKKIKEFFFYEIPLYTGATEVSENKVIDFEKLAHQIKEQESKTYKYLFDVFLEDKVAKELLDSYVYEAEPSAELVLLVCQKFQIDSKKVAPHQYAFIKDLTISLPIERALYSMQKIPDSLKQEVESFDGKVTEPLRKYISKKYSFGGKALGENEILNKISILNGQCFLLKNRDKLDSELKKALSLYHPLNPASSELRHAIVLVLNQAIHDESFFYHFSELKMPKNLKSKELEEEIRDFFVKEEIVLPRKTGIPLIVFVLALGSVIFTIFYRFVNFVGLYHAFEIICGKFNNPNDRGEINHFQSLTFALSATVGLGNIAGIATAICMGGPGIIFWMWLTALFGMATKFNSCLFSQVYREIDPTTGKVKGGPMYYLSKGIADNYPSFWWLGKVFAIVFSVFCILASFGGGNMFQVNQAYESISSTFHLDGDLWKWIIGFVLAISMAIVTIGGVKKIGYLTARIVPFMCIFYVATCLIIILKNYQMIPSVFADIFVGAFNFKSAAWGGLMCIFLNGVKRATFSNEAGLGSSAIIHATTKTEEPVREGMVAMLEPFIDTIFICTITAITILATKANLSGVGEGIQIISVAFTSVHPIFLYLLTFAVILFAISALITWCYCGERSIEYLLGSRAIIYYRIVFVSCIIIGPIVKLNSIIVFSDMMMLCMAFPNIIGGLLLFKKGNVLFTDYWRRVRASEILPPQK